MRNKKVFPIIMILAGIVMAVIAVTAARRGTGSAGTSGTKSSSGKVLFLADGEYEEKKAQLSEEDFSASDVLWQGKGAACDEASSCIYIPCDPEDLSSIGESADGSALVSLLAGLTPADEDHTIYVCLDQMADDVAGAIADGHLFEAFTVSATGDETREAHFFHIVLTGLPALCLDKTDEEEVVYKEEHQGAIRYIATDSSGSLNAARADLLCRFHLRGNVSSTFDKKPYKLSLIDQKGQKRKVSLGGMREDDDWILNPLFTDSTRVREMTAYALWDRVTALSDAPQASSRMQYVELFYNNSYQGIYGLMEPVDGKQLGLTEGDLLYKIDRWNREYPYIDLYPEKEGETEILNDSGFPCVEIKYPRKWDYTASWIPMQAYHLYCFKSQDSEILSKSGLEPDMDSIVTMSLYCALTHAMDNTWKNGFLVAKRTGEGRYTLYRTIWDLNYVFGDVFVYNPENLYTAFDPLSPQAFLSTEDSTYDYEAFLKEDPSLEETLVSKWTQWREAGISADSVCEEARANMELLTSSGAMERELQCWPQDKTGEEALEEMEEWIRTRFAYLDERYGWTTK